MFILLFVSLEYSEVALAEIRLPVYSGNVTRILYSIAVRCFTNT